MSDKYVLISEDGLRLTYEELYARVQSYYEEMDHMSLVMLIADSSAVSILCYLICYLSNVAVILVDAKLDIGHIKHLLEQYNPDGLWCPDGYDLPVRKRYTHHRGALQGHYSLHWSYPEPQEECGHIIPENLAVMLPTSGSTGSEKYVMLSHHNIRCNVRSIIHSLELRHGDRAAVLLPVTYSYGLSIVNSYLTVGGTLLIPTSSLMLPACWEFLEREGVQAICGVPYHYEIYEKMKILDRPLPGLKLMTQAGGAMERGRMRRVMDIAVQRGINFAVMYGQTEASPRMSSFFLNRHPDKLGSVGRAVSGGRLQISEPDAQGIGEILYYGPNVYMGYAQNRRDIERWREREERHQISMGDEICLHTGDIGYLDESGYLYITGRQNRFVKIRGYRISLDGLQTVLTEQLDSEIVCILDVTLDKEQIYIVYDSHTVDPDRVEYMIRKNYQKLWGSCRIVRVEHIPHKSSGKTDYERLRHEVREETK